VTALPAVAGVTHRWVEAGDVRLHVAEAGDGPPLLLLHGWPQHWWCWRGVMGELAVGNHVLAPDLRGFGWSDAPPGSYAKRQFAADVVALLDAEGIDRVRVIGHDWGGYTALLLAVEHPERVERVLALDVAPPWLQFPRPAPRHLALPVLASYQVLIGTPLLGQRLLTSGPSFVRALIRASSGRRLHWTEAELDTYANVLREPPRAAASSACYRTFLTRELPRPTGRPRLEVPTLLAMGSESALWRVLRPQEERNLQVTTVPASGHFVPEEAPEAVIRLARDWLNA
jgi:pimeloyl-ACP methyl ester carboxylesterase